MTDTDVMTLATEAAAHWEAENPRLLRNRENAVFEVTLGKTRAALRLHRMGYQSDQAIWSELWWCAALANEGVAVPSALPDRNGNLMVTLSSGRRASVISWVEGEALGIAGIPYETPREQLLARHRALGALVRDFHRATVRLTLPPDFQRPAWDIPGLVGETPFWGRFWDHPSASADQRRALIRARDFLTERLSDHARTHALQPIHADVLRENVLMKGEALTLIDFDDAGWGFPLYDLGTVMSQNLYEPARDALFEALCDGYGSGDLDSVRVMTLARTCASVGWTMPRLSPDDPINARHIARALTWAEQVMR
jgi:Ser/Thr protein kinase RdoA (MazF antagonist)